MNHNSLGTSDGELGSASPKEIAVVLDFEMARGPADGDWSGQSFPQADRAILHPTEWDGVKASQARSDLIKATIIFFGLDSDCPSDSGTLGA